MGATHVVMAIDTDTDVIEKVIYLGDVARAIGLEPWQLTYVNAVGLVYQPQENYLYIAHLDRSFISIYDLNADKFLPNIIFLKGFFPNFIFSNDDISRIYTLNIRSDNVSVIDVTTKTVEKLIDLHEYLPTNNQGKKKALTKYILSQNYPNPFNPTTTISYELPKSSFVKLSIYDISGRLVETLVNEQKNAGYYSVNWNVPQSGISSGIYIYRIDAGEFSSMKKCLVVK